MKIEDFAARMLDVLPQIIRGVMHNENNYLSRGKITIPQFWTLEYLYREGTSQMSTLADFFGITRPAATGLIDRLIMHRLVKREYDEKDRRIVWIQITKKGKKIIENIIKQKHIAIERIFSRISEKDRTQYLNILEKLHEILKNNPINKGDDNEKK